MHTALADIAMQAKLELEVMQRDRDEWQRVARQREEERDAALAREEAAERVSAAAESHLEQHRQEDPHEVSRLQHAVWQLSSECKALSCDKTIAESRLAAATELQVRIEQMIARRFPDGSCHIRSEDTDLLWEIRRLNPAWPNHPSRHRLSTAPTQAAEPGAWPNPDDGFPGLRAAQAAEPAAVTAETTAREQVLALQLGRSEDALRECRAELSVAHKFNAKQTCEWQADILAARERGREATRADLATARARIAELEAENTRAAKAVLEAHGITNEHKTRIAQAVVELEKLRADFSRNALSDGIDSAVAFLKGTRT